MFENPDEPFDGIILRTYPFGESDLILRVLSPKNGKTSILAKYARKEQSRFQVNFDIFDTGSFSVKKGRGSMEVLTHFRPHQALRAVRSDLDKFVIASCLAEAFDLLIHEQTTDSADYYETLVLGLRALGEARDIKEALRGAFMSLDMLMQTAGFAHPEITKSPSLKNLLLLLDRIESTAEKQLSTKTSMLEILQRLKLREVGV